MTTASQETWNMNMQRLPCCHHQQPFQNHLLSTTILNLRVLSPRRPEWNCRDFPVSVMNTLYNSIFQAYGIKSRVLFLAETWKNIWMLTCENNEWLLQDHLLSKPKALTWWALSSRSHKQWMCKDLPSMTDLKLCLPVRHEQMCRSFYVRDECPLQYHLLRKLTILIWRALSPQRPDNEHTEASPVSQTNSLFKSIFWVTLLHQLDRLSVLGDLKKHGRGFPSVTDKWPSQDHFQDNYCLDRMSSTVSQENWPMNVKRLPQCHQWMAFSRPSSKFKLSYWLKALFPQRTEQWICSLSQCCWLMAFSRPSFLVQLSY